MNRALGYSAGQNINQTFSYNNQEKTTLIFLVTLTQNVILSDWIPSYPL